jgi:acid phosphatase
MSKAKLAIVGLLTSSVLLLSAYAVGATVEGSFPSSDHVFVIMLENQDFSQVFPAGRATNCSSSGMPYLCSLAAKYGTALSFYSNVHGSLLDYLYNTSGADWTASPSDCTGGGCASNGAITGDNLVRALTNSQKTWRGYFESMPSQGYVGGDSGDYVAHHNPFIWYSDVADSSVEQDNMYPFTRFATDVKANSFRNFSYIVPNLLHDADGTGTQSASALLSAADSWLKTNIAPLLFTTPFRAGGDGILMIVFDEGKVAGKSGDSTSDNSCSPTQSSGCGGHVAFVMVGPHVIAGSSTTNTYHFQDMLHTIIHLLGMSDYMNKADGASDIALLPGASN